MLLFPGAWDVSGLGLFGLRKFIPISTSVPVCDVKLEALLAGTTQTHTWECAVVGAPCVPHKEPRIFSVL